MKSLLVLLYLVAANSLAADINQSHVVNCVSYEASLQGTHQKGPAVKASGKVRQRFSEWLFAENFSVQKSRIKFIWNPGDAGPASIDIITTEKSHHQVEIRSLRKGGVIVVSNASDPFFNLESWTFALNFKIESLVATRVQSNVAALKAEVISYDCHFEAL